MGSKSKVVYYTGNKTDVALCCIGLVEKITSDHCKESVWSYPADYLHGYDKLYVHHTYGSNGDPPVWLK
jgi:hypothetical protein